MTMWLVRAGKAGEREALALEHGVAAIVWEGLPDLAHCTARATLEALLRAAYPGHKPRALANWHGQIWAVREAMQEGDLIVMPLKSRPAIALGRVDGAYRYRTDLPGGPLHTRPVTWLAEVPRRAFDLDILMSFGAFMTVCRVERNDAEQRVHDVLASHAAAAAAPPTPATRPASAALHVGMPTLRAPTLRSDTLRSDNLRPATLRPATLRAAGLGPASLAAVPRPRPADDPDLEEQLHGMIRDRIAQKFKGHQLATLVGALLEAQGYHARVSPPGADGGVDILCGSGPLGFDAPRIVVQVKSQDSKVDVRTLRELAGVMQRFRADHGLLVGWGGFNGSVRTEAAADYFRMRLWDASDVVAAVKEHYDRLPPAVRAEVPLKRVWTLVPNEHAGVAA